MERCGVLAGISEEPDRLTRGYGSPALRSAQVAVAGWMESAGMTTRRDAIGNLIGRYAGEARGPRERVLLLGSHLDTVRDAGRYDGSLGILVALAALERLHRAKTRLPVGIEVVAFADEEGLRYHSTFLGSRAVTGTLDPSCLDLVDAAGITLREAIRAFGGDPDRLDACRQAGDVAGYVEVHIEQGPMLDQIGVPIGVVTGIAGQTRVSVAFSGSAGHAGTVPMSMRRDALSAASEFVLAVEALARQTPGLVATVGQLAVLPGASNVIPGDVRTSLDVRHADDAARDRACAALHDRAERIAATRGIDVAWTTVQSNRSVVTDQVITSGLSRAAARAGIRAPLMVSGAGHDVIAMAAIAPVGMLFVRCAGGISHHPDESVSEGDVSAAIDVLTLTLHDGVWSEAREAGRR